MKQRLNKKADIPLSEAVITDSGGNIFIAPSRAYPGQIIGANTVLPVKTAVSAIFISHKV